MAELITRVTDLPPDRIVVENRLRPVSEAGVAQLTASIEQVGCIKDDLHVRRTRRGGETVYRLIAGAHRLEAAKRLGLVHVPAKVWHCSDGWARLLEIDDNLAHAELSALELATFLAERKRVHLRLYPQTAAGRAGAQARWKDAADTRGRGIDSEAPFAKTVAEKRDLSERHVRRLIQIGEALSPDEVCLLANLDQPPTMRELLALAKCTADDRQAVISATASAALKDALHGRRAPQAPAPRDPSEAQFRSLMEAWGRATVTAKRRFLDWAAADIAKLTANRGPAE